MYPIFPRGAFLALWAVAGFTLSPAVAEEENAEAVKTAILGAPLVFGGTKATPDDDTPPAPIAAPTGDVVIMQPHMAELQQKLREHPGQRRAARAAAPCMALSQKISPARQQYRADRQHNPLRPAEKSRVSHGVQNPLTQCRADN